VTVAGTKESELSSGGPGEGNWDYCNQICGKYFISSVTMNVGVRNIIESHKRDVSDPSNLVNNKSLKIGT
jgi:hypothetical protein